METDPGVCRSADGTRIAYERCGAGPPLVLVDPAGAYRALGPLRPLAELLAQDFTVFTYDRRGRGESGDTLPYAVEREVEDLAALVEAAGGAAFLYGVSSGGLLALHAVARGVPVPRLAVFEPPLAAEDEKAAQSEFTVELADLVFDGRRREAVEFFLDSIGVPPEIVAQMGGDMPRFEAIAHTLVYDSLISEATSLDVLRSVTAPTLVLDSEASSGDLTGSALVLLAGLPNGTHRRLRGEWHGVADEVLAPVLAGFFQAL